MTDTRLRTVDYLTTRLLAQRWKVTTRTIDRWVQSGLLPEPTKINGRKYWPADVEPGNTGVTKDGRLGMSGDVLDMGGQAGQGQGRSH